MTETIKVAMCAYHPRKKSQTTCQSCDKPICDEDTWMISPLDSNEIEVCTECHDHFSGKDIPARQKFKLWIAAAFIAIVAIIGVTPALTSLWGS